MRCQSLSAAEAYRKLNHFQPIEDGKRLCLAAFDLEAEGRAGPAALAFEDFAIWMGFRQEAEVPDRGDVWVSRQKIGDLFRPLR